MESLAKGARLQRRFVAWLMRVPPLLRPVPWILFHVLVGALLVLVGVIGTLFTCARELLQVLDPPRGAPVPALRSLGEDPSDVSTGVYVSTGQTDGADEHEASPRTMALATLARPRYIAAALTFAALRTLSEYPEGAPDYDPKARDRLFAALEILTPGLGNPDVLGLPNRRSS